MIVGIIVGIILVIDQVTKYVVASNYALTNIQVIKNFFYITYAENTGMAWSLLSGQQALFCLIASIAIGAMIWYLIYKKPDMLTQISIALLIAGAAGNLIDRLFYGYVRDFLNFYIFGYDFPIFNVADMALCIGVFVLLLASYLEEKRNDKTAV